MNDRERFLNWMNYRPVDRCPWWEMWYWRETLERWHDEGLPEDVNLAEWLGVDRLVPPDVPFANYMYYLERMKALTLNP